MLDSNYAKYVDGSRTFSTFPEKNMIHFWLFRIQFIRYTHHFACFLLIRVLGYLGRLAYANPTYAITRIRSIYSSETIEMFFGRNRSSLDTQFVNQNSRVSKVHKPNWTYPHTNVSQCSKWFDSCEDKNSFMKKWNA